MARCETVRIQTGDGAVIINKSDFDAKKHKLFVEKPARKPRTVKSK